MNDEGHLRFRFSVSDAEHRGDNETHEQWLLGVIAERRDKYPDLARLLGRSDRPGSEVGPRQSAVPHVDAGR